MKRLYCVLAKGVHAEERLKKEGLKKKSDNRNWKQFYYHSIITSYCHSLSFDYQCLNYQK